MNVVKSITIEDELKTSFLDYSMSVIVSRALPDVRDGLKPVHRRILYGMYQLRNFHNRPYLKSARIVGEVIGRYHPHGDSAVYDALVRMAQTFAMRYPLVDGQGNFGSIDGDSAAAMRYTEVRLHSLADQLLADLERGTVDFGPNYDNKEEEPLVLPTKFPQLLANGASGIAVGMATNIPPHNVREIVDALEALIKKPSITIEELMTYIHGPDFPTAGGILGVSGIVEAYKTGRGSIIIRGKTVTEDIGTSGRQRIVITEIPYQVNKAKFIERVAELVRDKKIEGISDIRDESAQEDIRVVIELKKGEMSEVILNNLYKQTPLQSSFGVNMVALNKGAPRLMNLKQVLEAFYLHRREVILRRTSFDLRKAEEKAHILLGLKTAVENIDEVVRLIRGAADTQIAHTALVSRFQLSDIQAKAILEMRLARLTGLERDKIVAEHVEIMKLIADLQNILDTPSRVTDMIFAELEEVRQKYADDRKTEILPAADDFTMESLVADEDVVVVITHSGYVKRTPLTAVSAQRRGGKGRSGIKTKEEDLVKDVFITSNHQSLLCFTNLGRVYDLKVYRVPEAQLAGKGKHFANLVKLLPEEAVVSVLPIREFKDGQYVVSVTEAGYIKKTDLMSYNNLRQSGLIALKLDDGDRLVSCNITNGQDHILLATRLGKAIRFHEEEIRPMGRSARGVTGIKFSEDNDRVIGLEVIKGDGDILSICENGYGKRSPLEEYRSQSRGGKGIYTIKVTERNGPVVGILQVVPDDDLMMMTSVGKVMRFNLSEVGVIGRLTQGVRLMNVEPGEVVTAFARTPKIEGEEV
jgi:DNA gyrase subunit A